MKRHSIRHRYFNANILRIRMKQLALPLEEMSLQIELEQIARLLGDDLFGVADLAIALDFVSSQGVEYLRNFPRVNLLPCRADRK